MKVKELIVELLEYNLDADISIMANSAMAVDDFLVYTGVKAEHQELEEALLKKVTSNITLVPNIK